MGKPKLELCMFCSKEIANRDRTAEHPVPRALWDKERPAGTITLPAHRRCNEGFAADNEYFRDVVAILAQVGDHPEVRKLLAGKLSRKIQKRPREMARTYKGIKVQRIRSPGGVYYPGLHPVFEIEWNRIQRVVGNVVKGVYYKMRGQPVSPAAKVEVHPVTRDLWFGAASMWDQLGPWRTFGDTVFACRCGLFEEPDACVCLTVFYEKFGCLTVITPPGYRSADSAVLTKLATDRA